MKPVFLRYMSLRLIENVWKQDGRTMTRVALELNDKSIAGVDLRHPEEGNPGVGGSEYLFALLAYALHRNSDSIEVTIYHYRNMKLPQGIREIIVKSEDDLFAQLDKNEDILIHQVAKDKSWYYRLDSISIKGIAWAHVYPQAEEIMWMSACRNTRRVVFVGKEEYDAFMDDDIILKSTYIYNMVNTSHCVIRDKDYGHIVTYVGSLVPAKGFHLLAQIWSSVLKEVPDAQLNVIGNGRLYDRGARLGEYNIAQESYEKTFMKYLTDERGVILPSVHFLGIQNASGKNEVLKKTAVGVVNPSGISETFCMSAVEMELRGIPVVTVKKYGLVDTVKHKRTGLLFHSRNGFIGSIIKLLKDKDFNNQLSDNGIQFVKSTFDCDIVAMKWMELFNEIEKGSAAEYCKPFGNYFNDNKHVRSFIRAVRFGLGLKKVPSLVRLKYRLKKCIFR